MSSSVLRSAVLYRTYSRLQNSRRESWSEICDRSIQGIADLGNFQQGQIERMKEYLGNSLVFPAGRWLWVGGTSWSKNPENFPGAYNCSSQKIKTWDDLAETMNLAMMGCGTGATVLEQDLHYLPPIRNQIKVEVRGEFGAVPQQRRQEETQISFDYENNRVTMVVGDSRQGWVDSFRYFLKLTDIEDFGARSLTLTVDLSHIRAQGEPLLGFGGTANPTKLRDLYPKLAQITNEFQGKKLNSVALCQLKARAAVVVVAGGIRRSAGICQGSWHDQNFAEAKLNLWQQDPLTKEWRIDPERDALRMDNHTRVLMEIPSEMEVIAAVKQQIACGEGAIQYAPEAIARANADLLPTRELKDKFIDLYLSNWFAAKSFLQFQTQEFYGITSDPLEIEHRLSRYGLNPCGEIIGHDFFCNLTEVHLNKLASLNFDQQRSAFQVAAQFAVTMLHHKFTNPKFQQSRDWDPIIGVSFTGLFDFFVNLFGAPWLKWWQAGRPEFWGADPVDFGMPGPEGDEYFANLLNTAAQDMGELDLPRDLGNCLAAAFKTIEAAYLRFWRDTVFNTVAEYCQANQLKMPNRCTTVQPAGTKSLLTNASCGWHPPKFKRYIRRVTFAKDDPVALTCLDLGYNVVPSASVTDEKGNLLDDPFDPRCSEWLVEIPIEVPWANISGIEDIEMDFSALAQIDFYLQVQQNYTTHNTSATFEVSEDEAVAVGQRIYQAIANNEGYVSGAILGRSEANNSFPRLPFEPISRERYLREIQEIRVRAETTEEFDSKLDEEFLNILNGYDRGWGEVEGPMGCDSDKCLVTSSNKPTP